MSGVDVLALLLAETGRRNQEHAQMFRDAHAAVAELIAENERLKRALRHPTTETFAQDVAEYESTLEGA